MNRKHRRKTAAPNPPAPAKPALPQERHYTFRELDLMVAANGRSASPLNPKAPQAPDAHVQRAMDDLGIKFEDVTPEQRKAAKLLNFGDAYGVTTKGFVK